MTHASQPGIWLPAVWTSADGTTWGLVKVATILPQQPMGPIAFGNGAYVVVIDDSLWQSTDLAHWSKVQQLASGTADGRQPVVRFANGWFAASVAGSKGDSFVYYSVNGRTWHVANVSGAVQTLVARPSGFVAVLLARDYSMPVVGSADGRLWKPLGALPIVNGQCNLDMLLCTDAMGITHGFIYSADGVDWQNGPWPAALTSNLAWGPSPDPMFVTVFSGPDLSTTTVYVIQPQVQP
jgi:hypothetical protein